MLDRRVYNSAGEPKNARSGPARDETAALGPIERSGFVLRKEACEGIEAFRRN